MSAKPRLLRVPERFRDAEEVLRCALQMDLTNVLVVSECADGSVAFLGTDSTMAQTNWLLDRAKRLLHDQTAFVRVDAGSA